MEHINLNMVPNGVPSVCHVSQFDNSDRKIRFHLLNGSDPYTLSGTETIKLRIRKQNNEVGLFDIVNTSSDYIDLIVLQPMSDVAGDSECEFQILDTGSRIGSFNFKMKVEPDAFDGQLTTESISETPVATFQTDLAEDLIRADVILEPIQDLNGYDHPWPAGGGKNKMPPFTDGVYTLNGITATVSNGKVTITGQKNISGSFNLSIPLSENFTIKNGTYIHLRNSYANASITVTFVGWAYLGLSPLNRVVQFSVDDKDVTGFNIYFASGVTEILNFTLEISIENTGDVTSFEPYENNCPISGHDEATIVRCGVNLFDKSEITKGKYLGSNGTETISGSYFISNYIKVVGGGKLTVSGGTVSGNSPSICFYDANKNYISGIAHSSHNFPYTYDVPANAYYCRETIVNADIDTFQAETGTTASTYHAYIGSKYKTYFDGLMNGTYGFVDLGSLTWVKDTATLGDGLICFRYDLTDKKAGSTQFICVPYENFGGSRNDLISHDKAIAAWNTTTSTIIAIRDDSLSSGTAYDFKTAMNGVYLIYERASVGTPISQTDIDMLVSKFNADLVCVVFGQTVYGGVLDVVRGKLRVDYGYKDLGTLTPYQRSAPNNHQFALHIDTPTNGTLLACTSYACVNKAPSNLGNYEIATSNLIGTYYPVILRNDDYDNAADLKESLDGVYLVYELATPIEVDIDSAIITALTGEVNNVFSDAGDVEVEYYKSTRIGGDD